MNCGKLFFAFTVAFHSTTWHPVPEQPTEVTLATWALSPHLQNQLQYPQRLPPHLRGEQSCRLSMKITWGHQCVSLEESLQVLLNSYLAPSWLLLWCISPQLTDQHLFRGLTSQTHLSWRWKSIFTDEISISDYISRINIMYFSL